MESTAAAALGPPGVRELDGKLVLIKLRRIRCNEAGEALTGSVDDIKIAVGSVIPSQANVCTHSLRIRGVHLDQRRQCQESGKRVVSLETAKQDRKVAAVNREPKAVPLFSEIEGQAFAEAICRSDSRLI